MRELMCLFLLVCAAAANLRQVDALQPLELATEVFGPAFDTAAQGLELQFLTALYRDDAAQVQAQLDSCEADFWAAQVARLQALSGDFLGLADACSDPSTAANQLIRDVFTLVSSIVPTCPDLSVDLLTDLNNLVASAASQSLQLSSLWTGPLAQWTAAATSPFLPEYDTFEPINNVIDSALRVLGSTDEELAQSSSFARSTMAGVKSAASNLAAAGSLSASDLSGVLGDAEGWASANAQGVGQIFQRLAQSAVPLAQALCALIGPLTASPSNS